ncbi:hypothetical protein CC78DRAFT_618338 [Lojkania enalia]|uniref:Uncharacterized protein n=1 Tax=Lojkania enalia TaxID=147567 RepID=A0A9P4N2H5_9PLEO|nr:hypothetical protein CC78DRAFT_618338 [Didymosphaeria enalia]
MPSMISNANANASRCAAFGDNEHVHIQAATSISHRLTLRVSGAGMAGDWREGLPWMLKNRPSDKFAGQPSPPTAERSLARSFVIAADMICIGFAGDWTGLWVRTSLDPPSRILFVCGQESEGERIITERPETVQCVKTPSKLALRPSHRAIVRRHPTQENDRGRSTVGPTPRGVVLSRAVRATRNTYTGRRRGRQTQFTQSTLAVQPHKGQQKRETESGAASGPAAGRAVTDGCGFWFDQLRTEFAPDSTG